VASEAAATVVERVCASCAAEHCRHSVPRRGDGFWPGACDICGRPTIVADPLTFGGMKPRTDTTRR